MHMYERTFISKVKMNYCKNLDFTAFDIITTSTFNLQKALPYLHRDLERLSKNAGFEFCTE